MTARRKRGNGEGSVFAEPRPTKTNPNAVRWVAKVNVNGTTRKAIGKTEAEAKRRLRELVRAIDAGRPVAHGGMTVGHLLDDWEAKALPNRSIEPSSVKRHRSSLKILRADLGGKRLKALTPEDVEVALERRAAAGYSKASCHKLRTTLGLALTWALRRGHIAQNVASVVELPTNARPAVRGRSMTVAEAKRFLKAAQGTPLEAMWVTMLHLGLRPGEAAGLSWDDVDAPAGIVHVRRSRKLDENGSAIVGATKTAQSVRSLDAPSRVISALRAHRKVQARQRLAAGASWSNPEDLVFTSATGMPSDPSLVRREFLGVVAASELGDRWTPNMLRHTAASLLSDAGVPLEKIADQLGHKDTRMASLHYRHRVRATIDAGKLMGELLRA